MADVNDVISRLLDEKNWKTLTGVDAIPSFAMDAVVLLKSQQGRIDHMLSLLGEADREKERLKEEIELLKAQNRPGFGG